jgi:bacillithiol system protein YtxJ
MKWNLIESVDQVVQIEQLSHSRPQLIFKHSTRCGISSGAKSRLDGGQDTLAEKMGLHFLDLLQHRDISNHIAQTFQITHQSPQVILLDKGKPSLNLTHYDIQVGDILKALPEEGQE